MSFHGVTIPTEGRADWLEKRKTGIGASDVAAILDVSPWKSPFEVWAEKTRDMDDREPTDSMRWGLKLEDLVISAFEEDTGLYVGNRQMLVAHPDHPWALATVDGLVYESQGPIVADALSPADIEHMEHSIGNYEGKIHFKFGRWDEIPDHYQTQIQWQLYVTGHDNGWLTVLHGGRQLEVYEYDRDQHLIDVIVDKVSAFRDTYLVDPDSEPPPIEGRVPGSKMLTDLWDSDPDLQIELASSTVADIRALKLVKTEKKRLEDEEKRLSARVKVSLQDAEVGLVDGQVAVTWKKGFRKGYTVEPGETRVMLLKEFD